MAQTAANELPPAILNLHTTLLRVRRRGKLKLKKHS